MSAHAPYRNPLADRLDADSRNALMAVARRAEQEHFAETVDDAVAGQQAGDRLLAAIRAGTAHPDAAEQALRSAMKSRSAAYFRAFARRLHKALERSGA